MKLFLFFFVFHLFIIHFQASSADIDCTSYINDLDIVNRNPFYVRLFLYDFYTSIRYNSVKDVTDFYIINDVNPSTNIYCLKNLVQLRLVNTNLTLLPDIVNFQKLNSLTIQTDNGYVGQHLLPEIGQLMYLTNLELNDLKNLEDLPNDIQYLIQLNSLTLKSMPNFNNIPDESIGKLINLTAINFIDLPNLSNLPSTINNFQYLQQLTIQNINIDNLKLQNLSSLTSVTIKSNSILKVIDLTDMPKLYSIDIQNNTELLTLNLKNQSYLQSLSVSSNNNLNSIDVENLASLGTISITDSVKLKIITIKNLTKLTSLSLYSLTSLESISFDNTPALSSVSIKSSSGLKNVLFNNVPSMNSLDLSECKLDTFPESILTLKSLQTLVMTSNQLSSLPKTLSNDLPNLQVLYLVNNRIQENIFQNPLVYVRELYISNNSLTSLDGIGRFQSLQILELDFNEIPSIPMEIMSLSATLNRLKINNNALATLPYSMTNMRSLGIFMASNNNISLSQRSYLLKMFQNSPVKLYI